MNRHITVLFVLLLSVSTVFAAGKLPTPEKPDPEVTTGELCDRGNADFEGYRYKQKIAYCRRNVEPSLKAEIYEEYGVKKSARINYTIDHFIPLSIGGSNSRVNLWPEHKKIKALRANLETEVFEAVRDGHMTQEDAVQKIIKAKMNPPLSSENNLDN